MKRLILSTVALAALAVLSNQAVAQTAAPAPAASQTAPGALPASTDLNTVVGKVNGQVIRIVDVIEYINNLPPAMKMSQPLEVLFPQILQLMAERNAIVKFARTKGVDKSPEFKKRKEMQEMELLAQLYLDQVKKTFTDEELKSEFDVYMKEFVVEDQIRARHILVKEEKEALDILESLKKGGDFAKIATEKSMDPVTARNGGDLGFFGKKDLIPEFIEAVSALGNKKMTEKPVKTRFGYHIILREEDRKSEPLPFEKAKAEALPQRLLRKQFIALYKDAIDNSKIELFNMDGKTPLKRVDPFKTPSAEAAPAEKAPDAPSASTTTPAEAKPSTSAPSRDDAVASEFGKKAGELLKK